MNSVGSTYHIRKQENSTFDVFQNEKLLLSAIPEGELERQLAGFGIKGSLWEDIRRQLAEKGSAAVTVS